MTGGRLAAGGAGAAPEQADSYRYDPDDPVPDAGRRHAQHPGRRLRPAAHRGGAACTYTSAPLERDLTVIGDVRCVLHAMSSAPDTDFVVRLTDVHPDGFSRLLCDGILRARYRDSATPADARSRRAGSTS